MALSKRLNPPPSLTILLLSTWNFSTTKMATLGFASAHVATKLWNISKLYCLLFSSQLFSNEHAFLVNPQVYTLISRNFLEIITLFIT